MFKNFPWCIVKEFLCSITFSFMLLLISLGVLVSSASAQVFPSCSGGTVDSAANCSNPTTGEQLMNDFASSCISGGGIFAKYESCGTQSFHYRYRCHTGASCSCPSGYTLSNGVCAPPAQTPQECGITGFPIWNGYGYDCVQDFNTPCPEGTTNGMYTLPGYDPRPYCADATPPNSSSAGSASSGSGQNSSSNNSDGSGDGSGSSSGNTGNSSSASSVGGGGNSSGSASSGQGGSASSASGECDPTAKNYLECLNSKEINLPTEKGTFDGTGTDAEDRIGELEGELTDLVNQIKGEIQDVTGASVGGSGTLTDKCYQILKVQVCFGWARWSSLLSVIGTAIIAAAGVASFIIIMRQ